MTSHVFQGSVSASVTVINQDDVNDVTSMPGDMSTVDEEGESQSLRTFGMFAMSFEDEDGNRLSVPGDVTISLPLDAISNDTDVSEIQVWNMNPDTG